MSEQQDIPMADEQPAAVTEAAPTTPTLDDGILRQVRSQFVGLLIAFLILSVSFGIFVYKQNRNMKLQIATRAQQVKQIQDAVKPYDPVLRDLAGYSLSKPELTAIFSRYGMQIGQSNQGQAPAGQPAK
jgi:hypothetical protein